MLSSKIIILLFGLSSFLLPSLTYSQQVVQLGSGTTATGIQTASPINIYFESLHGQMVYTAAELSAAGAMSGYISKLGFYIESAPTYALPNYSIKIKNTSAVDPSIYDAGPFEEVYFNPNYAPTAGSFELLTLNTPFYWNGTDNILIDVCFDPVLGYAPSGTVRYYTAINGFGYAQNFGISACSDPTYGIHDQKPQLQIAFVEVAKNDAGVVDIVGQVCSLTELLQVKIANYGSDTLQNVTINWSLGGQLETPITYTTPIDTLGSGNNTALVNLGNGTFNPGQFKTLKTWTSNPNGVADTINFNDTLEVALAKSLSGIYTIGGASPDYSTFTAATNDLNTFGICDSVIFNVRNGTYNEQININEILGTDSTSTVTFQSESGDSSQVILVYAATDYANNYTLRLNGADWVTFKGITIEATGSAYSNVIEITNQSNHNTFISNIVKTLPTTSPFDFSVVIYSPPNAASECNVFEQNAILNGSHGIYFEGNYLGGGFFRGNNNARNNSGGNNNGGVLSNGTIVRNNTFTDQSNIGIFLIEQNAPIIKGNTLSASNSAYGSTAIYLSACNNGGQVLSNHITTTDGNGIQLEYLEGAIGNPAIIANNFIYLAGEEAFHGIQSIDGANQNFFFNTIHVTNSNTTASTFYNSYGVNKVLLNNILVNDGGGYSIYINGTSAITESDYNDLFATGNNLGYWDSNKTTFADWQAASSFDGHSFSVDPLFLNVGDYPISESYLNEAAISILAITKDIKGETRNSSTPDIGADEWPLPPVDAGLIALLNPTNPFGAGVQPVQVVLKNAGSDTLKNVTIDWELNTVAQTTNNWVGQLESGETDTINIDTINLMAGQQYDIKAWTSMPNGIIDPNSANDTIQVDSLMSGLGGIYTIGGPTPDFATFSEAVIDLETRGVFDSVIFNVRNGTYTEQLSIEAFVGADPFRRVIFQAESGDSTSVTLTFNANSSNNYTVRLNGADYVTFQKMTLESTNTAYSRVVDLTNESNYISLKNNIIRGVSTTSTSDSRAVIYSSSGYLNEYFKLQHNQILNGSYGLYYLGNYAHVSGTEIIGNQFINQYYRGIYLDEHNSPKINYNIISAKPNSGAFVGIYNNDSRLGGEVIGNQIYGNTGLYGIYLYDMEGDSDNRSLVANNFAEIGAEQNGNDIYGIYTNSSSYQDIYYNTTNVTSTNINSAAFYAKNGIELRLLNNLFANTGGGYALLNGNPTAITSFNNNNLYTLGDNLIGWGGSNWTSLADWQNSGSTTEANSISVNPFFVAPFNYQTAQSALNGAAKQDSLVLLDIENELRDTLNPDIGADEIMLPAKDVGITAICPPGTLFAQGKHPVGVILQNHGLDTIKNVAINWTLNNLTQTTINWSGTLLSGDTIKVALDSIDFLIGQTYDITSWTANPNGMTDVISVNDTSEVVGLSPALGGIYTIGGNSPDFISFTDAASALHNGGVIAAVTFNVRIGNYEEQVVLQEIRGVDSLNVVIFQSELGDSTAVVLRHNSTSFSNNYTLKLDGADWIHFHAMTFQATNSFYGNIIELTNGATHLTFSNNEIISLNGSTNGIAIHETGDGINEKNTFIHNRLLNGGYGIFFDGNYNDGNYIEGTIISNNIFENCQKRALYASNQSALTVSENTFIDLSTIGYYAIYLSSCYNGALITKNDITNQVGRYGIFLDDVNGTADKKVLIANNLLKMQGDGTYDGYVLYSYYGSYHQIYHNSVSVINPNTNSKAISIAYGSNKEVHNNIFANFGGGYAYFVIGSGVNASNNNNLFSNGVNLGYWGNNQADLAAWQTASNQDAASLSINPGYFNDTTDLHVFNVLLDKAGKVLPEVTDDFDGDFRDLSKPDIGADEFSTTPEDAGILSVDGPEKPFASGSQAVHVTLLNNGVDTLETVTVNWEVNGIEQPTYDWTGSLLSGQTEDSLNLGNHFFEIDTAYTITAWTDNPNGIVDPEIYNDTARLSPLYAGIIGIYTIGGVNPDFPSFNAAVTTMKRGGILGKVTFNVRNGTYYEQLTIPEILGADSLNTITFQSELGDSTAVILTYANETVDSNYTLQLNGTDWLTFRKMTIQSTSNTYARTIDFSNGTNHNTIENCLIKSTTGASSSSLIYSDYSINNNHNKFLNNWLDTGSFGISWEGYNQEVGNQFIGNTLANLSDKGIYVSNQQGVKIKENVLELTSNDEGIECYNCDGSFDISKNQLIGNFSTAILLTYCDATSANRGLISNNFIQNGGSSGNDHGFYLTSSNYIDIAHNTVRATNTATSSVAFYANSGTALQVQNNIFSNFGGGRAIYVKNPSSITSSNYNNLYATGTNLGYWNGDQATFLNWQTASGQDINSFSLDPDFITIDDFHVEQVDLNKTGTPIAKVTEDLDGDPRSATTPDIGADEFMPITTNDAEITTFTTPNFITRFPSEVQTVFAELKNNGADTLMNVTIQWQANNIQQIPYSWTGFLKPGERDTVALGDFYFTLGFGNDLLAYTQNPNGQIDNNPENDTAKVFDLYPALSGVYTIGGVFPDFQDFTAAVNSLNKGGVYGPVIFNARNGSYEEQISIHEIKGSSATNTVLFQSESGDSSKVKLHAEGSYSLNYVVLLDGADYVTFSKMTIEDTGGGSRNTVIEFRNGATHNVITNNHISTTAINSHDELIYSSNSLDSYNQFYYNYLSGGGEGIYLKGQNTSQLEAQTVIIGNTFENQSENAIYLTYQEAPQISNNQIQTNRAATHYEGIYCNTCTNELEIAQNKINSSQGVGILLEYCDATSATSGLIANNFVQVGGSNNAAYGIYTYYGSFLNFHYNSVNILNSNASSRAFYSDRGDNKNLLNNIFANSGGGYAIYVYDIFGINSVATSNFNGFYSTGPNIGYWNGNNAATVSSWRALSNNDFNSVEANPLFYNETDLHILQVALDSAGTTIPGITTDIDGEPRNGSNPDIGADEFDYLADDLGVIAVYAPSGNCDLSNAETVQVLIQNFGGFAQTGFDIAYRLADNTTIVENVGSLTVLPGDTASFTFSSTLDLSSYASQPFESYTLLTGELNALNDTVHTIVTNLHTPEMASNMLPSNGALDVDLPLYFSWSPADGADRYDLYLWIQDSIESSQPITSDLTQITYVYSGFDLIYGATYNWKIVAKNDFCETVGPTQSFTLRELPDLVANNIQVPTAAFSGQEIQIDWVVENQALGNTGMKQWTDAIYLSTNTVYDRHDDVYLGGVSNFSALPSGQNYSNVANVSLPEGIEGDYYILIITDRHKRLIETDKNNNTNTSSQFSITLTPPPDLEVSSILVPNNAFSEQEITVNWTVTNDGFGPTKNNWVDRIYFSDQTTLDIVSATYLGQVAYNGMALQVNDSYSQNGTYTLPQGVSGIHYVHIVTDYKNTEYEHSNELNNTTTSTPMNIILTPPPDLFISAMTTPAIVTNKEVVSIDWSVINQGGSNAAVTWVDKIYFSDNPTATDMTEAVLVHTASINNPLTTNESYARSIEFTVPDGINGTYYIYFHTDAENNLYEFNNENNNLIRSSVATVVQSTDLVVSNIIPANTTINSGDSLSISWLIQNIEADMLTSKNITEQVYLSELATNGSAQYVLPPLSTISVQLEEDTTLNRTTKVIMPDGISGQFYIYVKTDYEDIIYEGGQEANNVNQNGIPVQVNLAPWVDLDPITLSTPTAANAGELIPITLNVENKGTKGLINKQWKDKLYLSSNPIWNAEAAQLVRTENISDTLAINATYSLNSNISLPIQLPTGNYYLYANIDEENDIYEYTGEPNNQIRSVAITVTGHPPVDLSLTNITGPSGAATGDTYTINWSVQNISGTNTIVTNWMDAVYLSRDTFFNKNEDIKLGEVLKFGPVNGGSSYDASLSTTIPNGLSGVYYLFGFIDSNFGNTDGNLSNNIGLMRTNGLQPLAVNIQLTTPPDLVITELIAPSNTVSGQPVEVIWKVKNDGLGDTRSGNWTDRFYLSTDFELSNEDLYLGAKQHTQNLLSGASILDTISLTIPVNEFGNRILIVKTDYSDNEYEHNKENNNIAPSALVVEQPAPSDLIISDIAVPTMALVGSNVSIDWTIENIGFNPATGVMTDAVYLSTDIIWDINDALVKTQTNNINLAPEAEANRNIMADLSGISIGDYHVIVRTDILNNIYELIDINNTTYSTQKVAVDVAELVLNVSENTTLQNNKPLYYRIEIPASLNNESLLVTLNGDDLNGNNELYMSFGEVPTRNNHDFAFKTPFFGDQEIVIPELQAGTYYIMSYGTHTAANSQPIQLLASILNFEIRTINAPSGGNTGNVTVKVHGAKFEENMIIQLVKSGDTLTSINTTLVDPTQLYATFDLSGADVGDYTVVATKTNNNEATLFNGFEVVEGSSIELATNIIHPSGVRTNRLVTIIVEFANNGNVDIPYPEISLKSLGGAPIAFLEEDLEDGILFMDIVLLEKDGPADVLRPGATGSITVYSKSSAALGFLVLKPNFE